MSAERLAVGDEIKCLHCHRWHPAETTASGSQTDYASLMLYIRCGQRLYFAGAEGAPARDPARVRRGASAQKQVRRAKIYRYILGRMTPQGKVPYFTKLDPALREDLRSYKAAQGVPESEQIDRALRNWFSERHDVMSAIAMKYRVQLDAMTGLHEAAVDMMRGGGWTIGRPGLNLPIVTTMMGLLTKSCKTFKSIQTLCQHGLHEDAYALVRVLLETTVAIDFILREKSKERASMYHAHGLFQQIKMMKHWKKTPELAGKVSDDLIKYADVQFDKYLKRLPPGIDVKRHWSGEGSLEGALKALGDSVSYPTAYRFTSAIIHAADFGVHFERAESDDDMTWQIYPKVRGFEGPSYAARELLFKGATCINDGIGLGFDAKLAPYKLTSAEIIEGKK